MSTKIQLRRARVFVAATVAVGALAAPAVARADAVTDWNLYATTALMPAQAPPVSVVHLAIVQGAVYDAVNAIERVAGRGFEPYLASPPAMPMDSKEAAAATAAYHVLLNIVAASPNFNAAQKAALTATLGTRYADSLAAVPDGPAKDGGVEVGEDAAGTMIAARTGDGRFGAPGFSVPTTLLPGQWRPLAGANDPNGWVRNIKPFLIDATEDFRTAPTLDLTSAEYAAEFNEVKSVGSAASTTRTADQEHSARYWAEHPPATWSRIFRQVSDTQGVSLAGNARLFAMLYLTAADAAIVVWNDKEYYSFWRPQTAIQLADTDGNPATEKDAAWTSLIPSPPYPDHPSGHLGLSSAFAETLKDFFGTPRISWTDTNVAGRTRSYDNLGQVVTEIVSVRVWSGIHFRHADQQSAILARKIAHWRQKHYFQPLG